MKLKAICGREFVVEEVDEELSKYPEYVFSSETSCATYMNYNYWVTHNNDPK